MNAASSRYQRPVLGWVVGIASFLATMLALGWLGDWLGVASSVDLDEPVTVQLGSGRTIVEETTSSLTTHYGRLSIALALILALWVGFASTSARLDAGWNRRGWVSWQAWFVTLTGSIAWTVFWARIFQGAHFRGVYLAYDVLTLGGTIALGLLCYRWWRSQVDRIKAKPV